MFSYLRKNRFHVAVIGFLCIFTLSVLVYSAAEKRDEAALHNNDFSPGPYDHFMIDKLDITERKGDMTTVSLSADKIIHRKRASRFFVYQNLKEIFISGARIDIVMNNNDSANDNIAIPLNNIGDILKSLGKSQTPVEEYLRGTTDINLDLLTRILFRDIAVNVHLFDGGRISISADSARINFDSENIILEDHVHVADSANNKLLSSMAVWSKEFNGVYLPEGYRLQNEYRKEKAFFAVDGRGEFSKVNDLPDIKYADFIEEGEKVLYDKLPAYVRLMP